MKLFLSLIMGIGSFMGAFIHIILLYFDIDTAFGDTIIFVIIINMIMGAFMFGYVGAEIANRKFNAKN